MIPLAVVISSLIAYVAIALARYRHGHVKRALAYSRGEKSPGWHGDYCGGVKNVYRYHSCREQCYEEGEGCKGPVKYGRCNCDQAFFWAIFWPVELLAHPAAWTYRTLAHIATPDVDTVGLDRRQRRIAELEKELGIK